MHIALIHGMAWFLFLFFLIAMLFILSFTWKCLSKTVHSGNREIETKRARVFFVDSSISWMAITMTPALWWLRIVVSMRRRYTSKKNCSCITLAPKSTALKISFRFCFHFAREQNYVAHKTHNSSKTSNADNSQTSERKKNTQTRIESRKKGIKCIHICLYIYLYYEIDVFHVRLRFAASVILYRKCVFVSE